MTKYLVQRRNAFVGGMRTRLPQEAFVRSACNAFFLQKKKPSSFENHEDMDAKDRED
jgi:hypothetical protein